MWTQINRLHPTRKHTQWKQIKPVNSLILTDSKHLQAIYLKKFFSQTDVFLPPRFRTGFQSKSQFSLAMTQATKRSGSLTSLGFLIWNVTGWTQSLLANLSSLCTACRCFPLWQFVLPLPPASLHVSLSSLFSVSLSLFFSVSLPISVLGSSPSSDSAVSQSMPSVYARLCHQFMPCLLLTFHCCFVSTLCVVVFCPVSVSSTHYYQVVSARHSGRQPWEANRGPSLDISHCVPHSQERAQMFSFVDSPLSNPGGHRLVLLCWPTILDGICSQIYHQNDRVETATQFNLISCFPTWLPFDHRASWQWCTQLAG